MSPAEVIEAEVVKFGYTRREKIVVSSSLSKISKEVHLYV
jgi:hypothetical protein